MDRGAAASLDPNRVVVHDVGCDVRRNKIKYETRIATRTATWDVVRDVLWPEALTPERSPALSETWLAMRLRTSVRLEVWYMTWNAMCAVTRQGVEQ